MLTKEFQYVYTPGQPYEPSRSYSRTCASVPPIGGGGAGTPSGGSSQDCYTIPLYGAASSGSGGGPGEGGTTGSTVIGYEMVCNGQVVGTYFYG